MPEHGQLVTQRVVLFVFGQENCILIACHKCLWTTYDEKVNNARFRHNII